MHYWWIVIGIVLILLYVCRPKPNVALITQPVPASPVPAPSGVPLSLLQILQTVTDVQVPPMVAPVRDVPYDDEEIKQILRPLLAKINGLGANVVMVGNAVKASKTVDGNGMVQYTVTWSVYDARDNVSVLLTTTLLVTSSAMYAKDVRLATPPPTNDSLGTLSKDVEYAEFVDPVTLFQTESRNP